MFWFPVAILAYFLLGVVSFGDRFLLVGTLPSPKLYAFFIGALSVLIIPIVLFWGFRFPNDIGTLLLGLAGGIFSLVALVPYFEAIARTEVSRVVPAVGAFLPIFTFVGGLLLGYEILSSREMLAFVILLLGGFLITVKKFSLRYFFKDGSLFLVATAAFLFALWFLSMKIVFDRIGFGGGFVLLLLGRGMSALVFLGFREVREGLFHQKLALQKRVLLPLTFFQSAGGLGVILQTLSVSLAKASQVPLINALEGTRYLFLFLLIWLASRWRPELLREQMEGAVLWQKIIAGAMVILGAALLAF